MSAFDGVSEQVTITLPIKITVECETEITITAKGSDDLTNLADDYINENYDDLATEALSQIHKSELKDWEVK